MAIFKKNKKEETKKVSTQEDNELKDEISKAYDEIMSGNKEEKAEEQPQQEPKDDIAFENEVFKSKVKAFKQERNQQNLIAVLKMLSGRKFLLPSVCNVEDPFEKLENGNVRLKEGTVFNPAFLTSTDKKVFLPIFTDEESMVQKSPSGVLLKLNFEQCVTVVYDEKNPVEAVVINPFTENMIIGIDLLKMVFKEKKKEDGGWINAGFMVLEPSIMDLIEGDDTVFEKYPLAEAARMGQLNAYRHKGFWQCMDTLREKNLLESLWQSGNAPWKIWE